ncbi:MAG TPA: hypothetical protein VLT33_46085, partial [Labilithrix sp.]|nr:hypothetical protein [Labilithrix sp.]
SSSSSPASQLQRLHEGRPAGREQMELAPGAVERARGTEEEKGMLTKSAASVQGIVDVVKKS